MILPHLSPHPSRRQQDQRHRARLALMGLVLCASASAWCQAAPDEEDLSSSLGEAKPYQPSVSIATGSAQPLRRAPAVATVITAEDIQRMGATDLNDVMETVPGVHVSVNNQGYGPLFVFRGLYTQFNPEALVLLNGMPLTLMFIGNRGNTWSGYPLQNVARIEVIRGPGSALYGADAYSGVINIITKSAADIDGTEIGLRTGTQVSHGAWALHGAKYGPWDVAASMEVNTTHGMRKPIESDAQSHLDALYGSHSSLAPATTNAGRDNLLGQLELSWDKVRLRAGLLQVDHAGMVTGVAGALDTRSFAKARRTYAQFAVNDVDLAPNWRLGSTLTWMNNITEYPRALLLYPAGAFGGRFPDGMYGAPNTWETHWRGDMQATYAGLAGHQLKLGIGVDDLDLYDTREFKNFELHANDAPTLLGDGSVVEVPGPASFLLPHRRRVRHAFAQDEWRMARDWTLTAGLRRDLYSDVGGTTNPRLALVWDASLDVTAKLLYGRAFRAPSFTELYSINNPVLIGNPALKPETIRTIEGALSWQLQPRTSLQLSVFHYDADDLITAIGSPQTYTNAGTQRGHGFELEARHTFSPQLALSGHYAWQRSIDVATGHDAGYAPRHHLYGRVDWTGPGGLLCNAQANVVAKRQRALGDERSPVSDYATVDLTLRSPRASRGSGLALSVHNLFNADVREPSLYAAGGSPAVAWPKDLPLPGRTIWVQWSRAL
jgi:outer membrane receptor protein involved in Fe transport